MIKLNNILIYALPRSGSTSLMKLLFTSTGREPKINFSGYEPFNNLLRKRKFDDYTAATTNIMRRQHIIKHLWNQSTPEQNKDILDSSMIKNIVFLYRRALFDQAVSRRVALLTNEWFVPSKYHPLILTNDEVDLQIQYFFYSTMANLNLVKTSGKPVFVMAYEDLFNKNQRTRRKAIAGLFKFLAIPYAKVKPALQETSTKNKYKYNGYYCRVLVNYDDLKDRFSCWNYFYNNVSKRPESVL